MHRSSPVALHQLRIFCHARNGSQGYLYLPGPDENVWILGADPSQLHCNSSVNGSDDSGEFMVCIIDDFDRLVNFVLVGWFGFQSWAIR